MDKIAINLIPQETLAAGQQHDRGSLLFKFSIALLSALVVIVVGTFVFRFEQKTKVDQSKQAAVSAQARVDSFKDQEASLASLKQRLDAATTLIASDPIQSKSFLLLSSLIPSDVALLQFTVEKTGVVSMTAGSSNLESLRSFLNDLVDPKQNQGNVSNVSLVGMTYAEDGTFRADISLTFK